MDESQDMVGQLADYAVNEASSRGRKFPQDAHPYRNAFERDRDRIIHCQAFRRLEGKTHVFTPGVNDSYRNRLTHSLEVSQIGRTIARQLKVNESLTEAVCLAHDLGHPPFGHMGEKLLDEILHPYGGFEHNRQTLRVVDVLEHPYADFTGLNLMYETRLGLAMHRSPYDRPENADFDEVNCSIEGQIANAADRIAYNCHDLEDGLRSGLIFTEQLREVELFRRAFEQIHAEKINDESIQRIRISKASIDILVSDCIQASIEALAEASPLALEKVYGSERDFVVLSAQKERQLQALEEFLLVHLYQHKSLKETEEKIKAHLERLFQTLIQQPRLMPPYYQNLIEREVLERVVCDYIAGMTDRFCLKFLDKT